jgi:threonine/homoserine/homoserine lactone efflux protein
MAFLEGFVVGLGMIIFLGPVFFTLLKSALQHGLRAGLSVATGILVSDVIVLTLCSFGAIPFFKDEANQFWLALAGSGILMALGLRYLLKEHAGKDAIGSIQAQHYSAYFAKGFLVNFVNPFVFVVWIGLIGMGQTKYGAGNNLLLYCGGILLGIFTTDVTKVVFAHRIAAFIKPNVLTVAYRIIGVLLLVFALRLLWFVIGNI